MAESTLALTRTEIKQVLGAQAGWGSDPDNWSANQLAQVNRSIKRGLRMAYSPPPTPFAPNGYTWNFLEPTASLTIFGAVTGTTSGNSDTTVTATAAKFYPTMIGQSIVFDTSGTSYTITGYTSSTVITIGSDATAETNDDTFTITPDYSYRLPDDFGNLIGPITHPASDTAYARGIDEVNEAQIRRLRERSTVSGSPEKYAVRPVVSDGSSGQRWEVVFWPDVDQVYSLLYKYAILPDLLVDTTKEYPLGGALHGEFILSACRSALDLDLNDRRGAYHEEYLQNFHASVVRDKAMAPKELGYMHGGGRWNDYGRHGRGDTAFTVNGTELSL